MSVGTNVGRHMVLVGTMSLGTSVAGHKCRWAQVSRGHKCRKGTYVGGHKCRGQKCRRTKKNVLILQPYIFCSKLSSRP